VTPAPPPTTAIADVLALRGRGGWLSPPLRGARTGPPVAGPAVTVSLQPGTGGFGPLYELLSGDALAGSVLVLSAPDDDVAVWGALLSAAARDRGAVAAVVAGAVRDTAALALPTWARATATVGPAGALEVSAIGAAVEIGASSVAAGDVVVVDADGVVAVPADDAVGVLADARRYADAEERVAAALAAGEVLTAAYRHKADVVAELLAGVVP
jgi:4-hydroxy-4-methyl-2-oxoglutarate aldolase